MAIEIERKYLVNINKWNASQKGERQYYRQGYLLSDPETTIRVRVTVTEERGYITIKGKTLRSSRLEYEYTIPRQEALEILDRFCSSDISKYRYTLNVHGKTWEVDEFLGANEGLVLAEIKLLSEDEVFETPAWITEEVTGIEKYYNSYLSRHPFKEWD